MKCRFICFAVLYFALSFQQASAFVGPATFAVVGVRGTDSLALRDKPSLTGRILTRIPFNTITLRNLGTRSNGWCYVQYAKIKGFAACKYLGESSGTRFYSSHGYTGKLPFYQKASKNSPIAGYLPPYETGIEGLGACSTTWCPINQQGKKGWVARKYLASWQF